eukprot:6199350-Pleurochrysis_carterae.AAC.7
MLAGFFPLDGANASDWRFTRVVQERSMDRERARARGGGEGSEGEGVGGGMTARAESRNRAGYARALSSRHAPAMAA